MLVHRLERLMGIETYATCSRGIDGAIRQKVEDFAVEELLVDGSRAEIRRPRERVQHGVLGASTVKNRYLLCVLVKRNWDMFQAVRNIANQLDISPRLIRTAGIKDAKAITAQHITIEGVSIKDVQNIYVKDIEVRPIGYVRNELSSFYLLGNGFRITIRGMKHPRSEVQKMVSKIVGELEEVGGVPNFFGHQRFGTRRPITHLVGKAIIKGDLRKAALLFLAKSSQHEHPASRKARRELGVSGDFKRALKDFPKQLRYERLILKYLTRKPDDFAGAFGTLPSKLRWLFVEAYQAYLFNRFLSLRIRRGIPLNAAQTGDYVLPVDRAGLPMVSMPKPVSAEMTAQLNGSMKAGKMRLAIPLIGFSQQPSGGVQGELEEYVLEIEDVSPKDFRIRAMPEMSSRGELRSALAPLRDFSLGEVSEESPHATQSVACIGLTLPRGSYATIVLRELMKPTDPVKSGF